MLNFSHQTKKQIKITAIAFFPVFIIATFFSGLYSGPGKDALVYFSGFLMMPTFILAEFDLIPNEFVFWSVIVFLQPIWIFIMVKGVQRIWKSKKES